MLGYFCRNSKLYIIINIIIIIHIVNKVIIIITYIIILILVSMQVDVLNFPTKIFT